MTQLKNEIVIDAPLDKIWEALANAELLDNYDPTVKKSTLTSSAVNGVGASRKVDMLDGKNWFEETCTVSRKNEVLKYELTACSFPVNNLDHSYSFEERNGKVKVTQRMNYQMKYGFLGKVLGLMIKPQYNKGIRQFLGGLKSYTEGN